MYLTTVKSVLSTVIWYSALSLVCNQEAARVFARNQEAVSDQEAESQRTAHPLYPKSTCATPLYVTSHCTGDTNRAEGVSAKEISLLPYEKSNKHTSVCDSVVMTDAADAVFETDCFLPGLNRASRLFSCRAQTRASLAVGFEYFPDPLELEAIDDLRLKPLDCEKDARPKRHDAEVAANKLPSSAETPILTENDSSSSETTSAVSSLAYKSTDAKSKLDVENNSRLLAEKTSETNIHAENSLSTEDSATANPFLNAGPDSSIPTEPILGRNSNPLYFNFSDVPTPAKDIVPDHDFAVTRPDILSGNGGGPTSSTEQPPTDNCSGIVIHPPLVQPYNSNQHTFVVENRGSAVVSNVLIEINVFDSARIVAVLPTSSAMSSQAAVFQFEQLAPGESDYVHVTAVSNNGEPIRFEAQAFSRTTYDFCVHPDRQSATLDVRGNSAFGPAFEGQVSNTFRTESGGLIVKNPYVAQQSDSTQPVSRR